ncbi:hypothetical protein [Paenibacillus alvei]|nr:hypothetical protein [Paenibacillus alvei]
MGGYSRGARRMMTSRMNRARITVVIVQKRAPNASSGPPPGSA